MESVTVKDVRTALLTVLWFYPILGDFCQQRLLKLIETLLTGQTKVQVA